MFLCNGVFLQVWAVEVVAGETRLVTASSDSELQLIHLSKRNGKEEGEGEGGGGRREGERGKRKAEEDGEDTKGGRVRHTSNISQ